MAKRDYTLVCHDDDPKWLSYRFNHVTASESSALMGRCPWADRDDLLRQKISCSSDFKGTRNTWWGSEMERFNMEMFTRVSGIRTRPCNAFVRSNETPLLAATIDGFALRPQRDYDTYPIALKEDWTVELRDALRSRSSLGLIEMKNTEAWWRKNWTPSPPEHYIIQVQQQLYVMGLDWCILCAKVGAADMVAYLIDYDPLLVDEIKEDAEEFWEEVENGRRDLEEFHRRA